MSKRLPGSSLDFSHPDDETQPETLPACSSHSGGSIAGAAFVGGGTPLFSSAQGAVQVWDADGNRYVDYVGSWGPLIAGHAHPDVVKAVEKAASRGLSFGAPTEAEVEMAALLCKLVPSIEQVRLVSSGTEATMSASLARPYRAIEDRKV